MPEQVKSKFLLFLFSFVFFCFYFTFTIAQVINVNVANKSIYDLVDELATLNIIDVNTAIKPYTRLQIATWLNIAKADSNCNIRLKKDIVFYLKDYNKEYLFKNQYSKRIDFFYYKDSNFSVSINPIVGGNIANNTKDFFWQRTVGAECFAYIGKNISLYGSVRDNNVNTLLFSENYLTQNAAFATKKKQGLTQSRKDFSDARGGIAYGNKLGSIGIYKDNFVWGNNNNGANIFSALQPSFGYVQLKIHPIHWLDFNYINGSLISNVLDSTSLYGSGAGKRTVMRPKNITTNMFTIKPFKHTHISFGNSMVYSDVKFNAAYLIPFAFYKSIDHTYNNAGSNALGQNSQLFFDVSTRYFKKLHLYSTLFIDEVNIKNIFKKSLQTNLFSIKAGFRLTNLINNMQLVAEYTRTNPWVYSHPISSTTFESSSYNLGHYLKQNAQDVFLGIIYKPIRGFIFNLNFVYAQKGEEYNYQKIAGTLNVRGTKFMDNVRWQQRKFTLQMQYEIINDLQLNMSVLYNNTTGNVNKYTPTFYIDNPLTLSLGFNVGF